MHSLGFVVITIITTTTTTRVGAG
ncbi:thrAB operon attenuation leader peptide ThrL [Shewanella sp. LC6]|uniref:ThrAB operon attenuation leader peptide ThrL n=4 Tax=Shewanella TaxID=22 RepID=K4PSV3_SHEON|nr:thrAB operon attenuation leader peptide ThrL [Shewanella oneidensis MR-1]ASF17708.1 thrAB operon attenuation leader peptide ThrL [Shewanella sp. FDAARGOS_354]ASK71311.1 thrAB operon attenuation leader peptide ThrL [Shewanella bicestrii]MDG5899320.1 thrAB operon attenuation leader peptide ThrL [Shewanella xiamenensis]PWF61587.1 thrAB operon attenuation leader peptide ThrL [Shewanella sp. BC20]PZP33242.1 MAG: thrAB operon attenuation leader peptide ThrL [Shewanella oneidensis]QQK62112.1 thrA